MSRKKLVVFQLAIALFLVLSLEGAARIAYTLVRDIKSDDNPGNKWMHYTRDLGWERRPNFEGPDFCGKQRSFDEDGLLSVDAEQLKVREADQKVAIFLGDSNTYGFCIETPATFVEVFDSLLDNFEAVNLGVNGYTSYQGYKTLLKYGEKLKPDIVFVAFNYNDRRYTHNNVSDSENSLREVASGSYRPKLAERIFVVRSLSWMGRKLGFFSGDDAVVKVRIDQLKPRVDPDSYRANLVKIVDWARQHGSKIVFISMGDNSVYVQQLLDGLNHLENGDLVAATKYLTYAADRPRMGLALMARMHLAEAYRRMGLDEKAEQFGWLDLGPGFKNVGGAPVRLGSQYNDIMHAVARELKVPVVDVRSRFENTPRVYFDLVHFDVEGHEIVGTMLADAVTTLDFASRQ